MSYNIGHEAVFPPAVHNLRRMSHLSPTRNVTNGSYELYDPQQKTLDSPERKAMNISVGTAPGSPGTFQDYNQVVENLQHELEHSKRKESDLQQMLADLKNPLSHTSAMFLENSYLEASPSNDSIGENVKDAHIRHLQRQVTVLQASLYKSEGWSNRVAAAVKERDKAQDDVARLTSRIQEMQDNNNQLLDKVESLTTALQETHKNLQQVTEQLHNQNYNGQLVLQLKDEVLRQNYEIKTLKDSLNRLDRENKGLKDPLLETTPPTVGNLTCSQELEHLHKVVDRLKSTVLQQRSYLLQLRPPSYAGANAKSITASPAYTFTDGYFDQDSVAGRNSSSPQVKGAGLGFLGGETNGGSHQQHVMFRQPNQALMLKSASPKENNDTQHHGSSDFVQDGLSGGRRKLNSQDILDEEFVLDVLNSQNSLLPQSGGLVGMESRNTPQITSRNGYTYTPAGQNQNGHFMQQVQGDVTRQNLGSAGLKAANGYEPLKTPQYRALQPKSALSDALSDRNRFEGFSQNKLDSKLDALDRSVRQWNLASANNSAMDSEGDNEHVETFFQQERGLNQRQGHKPPFPKATTHAQQEARSYEGNKNQVDTIGQSVLGGSASQMLHDNNLLTQFGNLHLNSARSQSEPTCQPPNYQSGSVRIVNHDKMGGGKITVPPSPTHNLTLQGAVLRQDAGYINASGDQRIPTTTSAISSVEQDPSRFRLNSDRLCPVCNNDYSHVSMEDFQSHIFECFDDEHPPETMKPHASSDRSCPMCNVRFNSAITQTEYEKHVHGHFGEEGPGDNFEILQP
uniref:UBZ1-type domain-containing protein n=1 Tax=Arion vulgaris TaxID=1028688 RepID=A0A0B7AK48_9EUPU